MLLPLSSVGVYPKISLTLVLQATMIPLGSIVMVPEESSSLSMMPMERVSSCIVVELLFILLMYFLDVLEDDNIGHECDEAKVSPHGRGVMYVSFPLCSSFDTDNLMGKIFPSLCWPSTVLLLPVIFGILVLR